jgi:hypothetical protein
MLEINEEGIYTSFGQDEGFKKNVELCKILVYMGK